MLEFSVRPAEKSDLPNLVELYFHLDANDQACPPDEAPQVFAKFLQYEGSAILLGFCESVLASSCTVIVIPNLTRGGTPYALIENVVTHAGYRNRGYGKAMLAAAVDRAWAAGCYKAMLMTGSKRPSTLAFYEAAGFEQSKMGFQIRRRSARSD